mmetsp:Transcript_15762/g.31770  ORF Transcript_15762/g.31770 Transcript_15762/m.31770 type:complete len:820 (+) Transcript_15762:415-2874(+)
MNWFFAREPASLDVDIDSIDTDDEDDGIDETAAIGWAGGEEDEHQLTEADVDPEALPIARGDESDEEEAAAADNYDAVDRDGGEDYGGYLSADECGDDDESNADDDDDTESDAVADTAEKLAEAVSSPPKKKAKTQRWYDVDVPDGGKLVFYAIDVETTGSSRQKHGIVKLSVIAVSSEGDILDTFERLVHQPGPFTRQSVKIHKIREKDVAGKPGFDVIGAQLNTWMEGFLDAADVGSLVAHNGNTCDYQFLCCEYQRHGLKFDERIKHTIDTKVLMQRYVSHLGFHGLGDDEWTHRTKKGNVSYTCSGIVDYLLSKPHRIELSGDVNGEAFNAGDGSLRFADVCGEAHDPFADAMGAAIILFDKLGIRKWSAECKPGPMYELLSDHWSKMEKKMQEPLITHEKVSAPWTEFKDGDVPPIVANDKEYIPKDGLKSGPSAALTKHIEDFLSEMSGIAPSEMVIDRLCKSEITVAALALAVFLFFFRDVLLLHISTCTNAHACQPWITATDQSTGKAYCGPPRTAQERDIARQKCKNWKHMSVAELGIFIGIVMKMGVVSFKNLAHYWIMNRSGFGCSTIYCAMKQSRFCEIYANLSFMMPGSTEYAGDRLRKIRWVNDYLLNMAQMAWNPEETAAIDESMIPTCSQYCPFRQIMKSKPIKCGIKVFCLVFSVSTYLYNWDVFLGSGSEDDSGSFVYSLVYTRLVLSAFNFTNMKLVMDNFFTSPKLFRALAARGIYCVGPTKATRPKKEGNRHKDSWCFQPYGKTDGWKVGGKGWMRHAVQPIISRQGEQFLLPFGVITSFFACSLLSVSFKLVSRKLC